MQDEVEIEALLAGYAQRYDARDGERFGDLFTDDAVLTLPDGRTIQGRDALVRVVGTSPPGGSHHPGRPAITVTGDTATANQRYRVVLSSGRQLAGGYEDELRRTEHGWRLAVRRISIDGR